MTTNDSGKKTLGRRLGGLWRRVTGGAGRSEDAQARSERVRLMYETFREILIINDSTLQLIADIEDRLSGRIPFSLNMMAHRLQRAVMDGFVLAKDLNQIADSRFSELYDALRRVNANLEAELSERPTSAVGPLVMPLAKLRAADSGLAGTKMANLGEVKNAVGLAVPEAFVITTSAFNRFMAENELWERAERLEEVLEAYGERVTAEACREVQAAILAAPLPQDLARAVLEAFDALASGEEVLVAVRSSAVGEDRASSHAGQYYTELNVGRGWLLDAYRWVIASSYGLGPVSYRLEHGLTAADARMAVGVVRMLEPRCSGILFSRGFEDLAADRIVISATPGLAGEVTGGSAAAEEIVYVPGREPPDVSASCLRPSELSRLSQTARRIEQHFGGPQDVEWGIDRAGKLFVLQSRAMAAMRPATEQTLEVIFPGEPLLAGGLVACPGAGAGPVFLVRSDEDLDRFPAGAVLVAPHSAPKFSRVMARAAAIITDRGSPTGHMAILAREFGVPTIVGLPGATTALTDGQSVTVDAAAGRVFAGIVAVAPGPHQRPALAQTPAVQKLRRLSQWVTPLHLIDPAASDFKAQNCETLHDITRFVHEKVFEVMFRLSEKVAQQDDTTSFKLEGNLPYDVWVFDVGGGFVDGAGASGRLAVPDIRSVPLLAFLAGLLDPRIKWDQPRAVSARGFLSVLGESMAGLPAEVQGVGRASFAIVSDRYLNFSTKAGYHFNTVDTYCGKSLNKNYIHFRFAGGGAGEDRRARRCAFLETVLAALDFKVTCRGDLLVARLEKYDREFIQARLTDLGRLTLCSRQLDMLMDNDQSPDTFARSFLAGELEKF